MFLHQFLFYTFGNTWAAAESYSCTKSVFMMANDTMITDDYVAELLAKEASEASIKYSSMGLEAFRSTKYV